MELDNSENMYRKKIIVVFEEEKSPGLIKNATGKKRERNI
jgi:hypothetical protein